MPLSLPVRRFIQCTARIEASKTRFGGLQWVLARPLYRFQTFELGQVPPKKRAQALKLELTQWTPFARTGYYIGWHDHQALVWCWDAEKVNQAIAAQGLKPHNASLMPESLLQTPAQDGLCLTQCAEGFEAQHWHSGHLERCRWMAQVPTPDEWLMFQRDAGILPGDQQSQPPAPRPHHLNRQPWVTEATLAGGTANELERLVLVMAAIVLLAPTLWLGFSLLKLQASTAHLRDQQAQLQREAEPLLVARGQALDFQARLNSLVALNTFPSQLALMSQVAQLLPNDKSFLKDWDFQQGQLKLTVSAGTDISTTFLIGALQQSGPFRDVKAIAGQDPKSVTFQMTVAAN